MPYTSKPLCPPIEAPNLSTKPYIPYIYTNNSPICPAPSIKNTTISSLNKTTPFIQTLPHPPTYQNPQYSPNSHYAQKTIPLYVFPPLRITLATTHTDLSQLVLSPESRLLMSSFGGCRHCTSLLELLGGEAAKYLLGGNGCGMGKGICSGWRGVVMRVGNTFGV